MKRSSCTTSLIFKTELMVMFNAEELIATRVEASILVLESIFIHASFRSFDSGSSTIDIKK